MDFPMLNTIVLRKKIILIILLFVALFVYILVITFNAQLRGRFRTMQDPISVATDVDLTGLREIQASGGDIPRFPLLSWRLGDIKAKKIIVDAELQGTTYIRGLPTTLLSYENLKDTDWKHYLHRLIFTGTLSFRPDLTFKEEQVANQYGFDYKHVVIGSRFSASDQNIDEIVHFLDTLPENTWVHFHCSHGAGRTSILLVMYDIMKNAPKVTLANIVERQILLGSVDLFDTTVWGGVYTKEMLENRKRFIEQFYDFICQRKAGGIQQWSDWKALKNKKTYIPSE